MTGSVWVPQWPVAAAIAASRAHPEDPIAVIDTKVRSLSPVAARAGIRVGDSRRHATYLCPNIVLVERDDSRDERYFASVLDAISDHVAHTTLIRPGLVTFTAAPPVALAGGYDSLAERLIGSIVDRGYECQVGFADGLLGAVLAAQQGETVADGQSRDYIARFPISAVLQGAPTPSIAASWGEVIETLTGLGVTTVGGLAALDRDVIASRFGSTGLTLIDLAQCSDYFGERWTYQDTDVVSSRNVEIASAEQATFLAKELADDVCEKLAASMLSAASLTVTARFSGGQERSRTWSISGTHTSRDLTDRVRWQITGWLSSDSDVGELIFLELIAHDLSPAGHRQSPLFGSRTRDVESVSRCVLQVQGMLGDDGVQAVHVQGGRYPAACARMENWTASQVEQNPEVWVGGVPQPWPAVVFPDPVKVSLLCECRGELYVDDAMNLGCSSCQRPALGVMRLFNDRRTPSLTHAQCYYATEKRVWNYAGPWHISGQWWDQPYQRAYLQVDVDCSPSALLYREAGTWYLEGIYS